MNTAEEVLQYLPMLLQLIQLVGTADTKFTGAGSSTQKAVWLAQQILSMAQANGLLANLVKGNTTKSTAITNDLIQLLTDILS